MDKLPDSRFATCFYDVARAADIDIELLLSAEFPKRNDGGSVNNRIATLDCLLDRFFVPRIADAVIDRESFESSEVGMPAVKSNYLVSAMEKFCDDIGTDTTRRPCYQNGHFR